MAYLLLFSNQVNVLNKTKDTKRFSPSLSFSFLEINQRSFLFNSKEFAFISLELSLKEELKLEFALILGKFGTIAFGICWLAEYLATKGWELGSIH